MATEGRRTPRTPGAGSSRPPMSGSSEILPMLGVPFFSLTMVKSNIERPFQVTIPKNFLKYLPANRQEVTLVCSNSGSRRRSNIVVYYGDMGRFCGGWKDFAEEHDLKLGDGVVFELKDARRLEFRVQILRKEVSSVIVID